MHKYNFGIIGNCSYLAYIDTDGNVVWMCMPRFDSSFIFGSLIDKNKGGSFYVKPASDTYSSRQNYLENTNMLSTEFSNSEGKFRVIDFAPRFEQNSRYFKPTMLIRKVEPIEGRPSIKVKCNPTGDYGKSISKEISGSNHIRYTNLGAQVRLTTNIPLSVIQGSLPFVLSETVYLIFTYGLPLEGPIEEMAEFFQKKTRSHWNDWVKTTSIPNLYQKEILRSALILKLHQYEDTGGIIASGSTSLPEHPGSGRNWDYRYCWMRDAFYTLKALNSLGHFEELEKYFLYIENIINQESERIQPLYSIIGERKIVEREVDLDGYLDSGPVRIGNAAVGQFQGDIYGELMDAFYLSNKYVSPTPYDVWVKLRKRLEWICENWQLPDAGIWEMRNRQEHFV